MIQNITEKVNGYRGIEDNDVFWNIQYMKIQLSVLRK